MERPLRRREVLAGAAGVALSGCIAEGGDGNGDDDRDLEADGDDQEESGDAIEPRGSSILDEDQLLEISLLDVAEFDQFRYLDDSGNLRALEPSRDRWVQTHVYLEHLGEWTGEPVDRQPAPDDIALASLEDGQPIEPVEWPHDGVPVSALRDDVLRPDDRGEFERGAQYSVMPVFDAPAGELAVDVAALLGRESRVWLSSRRIRENW